MTATTAPKTTVYYLSVPFTATANLQVELPEGMTDAQVLETIGWSDTREMEVDFKAMRCAVSDSITQREPSIDIERD